MISTMFPPSRHIPWEQLHARIKDGIPFVHRIPSPHVNVTYVDIRVSENGTELAMCVPYFLDPKIISSPLADLDISLSGINSERIITIKSRLPNLFHELYNFFVSIIDKIQLNNANPFDAINETLDGWQDLLKTRTILSEEAQLGLRGELYTLRMLVPHLADQALAAWMGPQNQPHDFRLGALELEVKATTGALHAHIINGLGQLDSSPERRLFVFSLRLAPAGALAGTTLPQEINRTRLALAQSLRVRFDQIIHDRFGYRDEHSDLYNIRLQLADKAYLIPVDSNCPRLSMSLLFAIPHRGRISDVHYRANFEGLGFPEGSQEFVSIISGANPPSD